MRRDLEALERDGVLRRVHGGATRARDTAEETPYAMRAFSHTEEKARIGAAGAPTFSTMARPSSSTAAPPPWSWRVPCEDDA